MWEQDMYYIGQEVAKKGGKKREREQRTSVRVQPSSLIPLYENVRDKHITRGRHCGNHHAREAHLHMTHNWVTLEWTTYAIEFYHLEEVIKRDGPAPLFRYARCNHVRRGC